ncbi:hypothetical protein M0D21_15550 [Aquimarina sp. D1M17]|uniref:hypothetical protein n=1 Tax=Aquimarina acroporae TaxID=2937283 RepID=UPI0020C1748E|nr:hypothetical protein [Aquimarina acroporae]MCK8522992.1 hypothetical protein [Aquimarina acroporae]
MKTFLQFFENKVISKIGNISLALALLGLISSFLTIYTEYSKTALWLSHFFSFVDLNLMRIDIFDIRGGTFTGGDTFGGNGLNLAFNFVFLLASIIYIYSKKKEKHLLQFIYAVIHFSAWVSIVIFVFSQFRRFTLLEPLAVLFVLRDIIILLLSYGVLKLTDKKLSDSLQENVLEGEGKLPYVNASKYKRFLHLIIDSFLLMGLTFNAFRILPRDFLNGMLSLFGDRYALTILFIFSAIAYYVFFETIFKRTPAKYLTQTFVTGTEKAVVTSDLILGRSLSRKIPFNTFSFLGTTGWHDSISNTKVVSLNRNKRDYKYLLLFPAIALFFFLNYQFNEFRQDYVIAKTQNGILNAEVKAIEYGLKNLKSTDIISLKRTGGAYYDASHFLKVLKVEGETVTLAKIEKTYKQKTLEDIDFLYESNPEGFETIEVDKEYIRQGICTEYGLFGGFGDCGFKYFEDEENMRIYSIDNSFEPVIHFDYRYQNSADRITIEFESHGVACQLTKIEVLEGDVEASGRLPQKITTFSDDFEITVKFNEEVGDPFKLKLVFESEIDPSLKYNYTFESDGIFVLDLVKVQ